ncbi:MAG: hypothetical protein KKA67_01930 [Spirochaetes bacterium]|nr:hypothetical protein [Spirochaetota bacterium]MBU1081682.1 hypothetical protein [Spirochaetota bacterium]
MDKALKAARRRYGLAFLACIAAAAAALAVAAYLESGFGSVEVAKVRIPITTSDGASAYIPGKLYRPLSARSATPAPAVLALHGYQNDKDTSAAYAMELARRGIVALTIDQFGHGANPVGLRERGYDEAKGGPARFKLFMSFSRLNGDGVPGIVDSSMGASRAFRWLAGLEFVRADRIGLTGHSMGTWSAVTAALENPTHAAVVLQCGEAYGPVRDEAGAVRLKNVLMLQARFEEFDYFRDYALTTGALNQTEKRYKTFAGQDGPIEWNRTYGDFADGSARRMELLETVHRGVTHSGAGMSAAMDWLVRALRADTGLDSRDLVFLARELLLGAGLVIAALSLMPLCSLLLSTRFFASVARPLPGRYVASRASWRKNAAISVALSALLYPFLTQLGHGLFPYPDGVFKTLMAGGLILWLDALAVIAFLTFIRWYRKGEGRRLGVTLYDLGVSFAEGETGIDWAAIGKIVLMAIIMFSSLYALNALSYAVLSTDLRFIWPFLRPFTPGRFLQFLLYLPFFLAFFLMNGGVRLFGQMRLPEAGGPARTQWVWWAKNVTVMLGGLVIVAVFEYAPFFLGFGTGWALLGLSLFDGPFMSALVLIIPQFFVLFFVATYCFRKTGTVYLGSLVTAMMVAWITCGGAAYF